MSFSVKQNLVIQELGRTLQGIREEDVDKLAGLLCGGGKVFIAGAGRSGLMARGFAMRLMHMGIPTYVVGEIVTPAICAGDTLLIASGSGETGSLVNMAKKAKKLGAKLGLVTIFPASTIGTMADATVRIPAPTPKSTLESGVTSVQPMGSLFEQSLLLTLDILIMLLMERTGKNAEEMFTLHANLE